MYKKLPATLAVIALLISIGAFRKVGPTALVPAHDTFDKVIKENQLTICYATWPPSVIKDPNTGKLSGFLIDAIQSIAADATLKLDYV